jgi:hypothetical protein
MKFSDVPAAANDCRVDRFKYSGVCSDRKARQMSQSGELIPGFGMSPRFPWCRFELFLGFDSSVGN